MWIPSDRQVGDIFQNSLRARSRNLPPLRQPTKDGDHFKVHEMRCVQICITGQSGPGCASSGALVQQSKYNRRGIHDDHRLSRSSLIASTTSCVDNPKPPRRSARSSTSSTVGLAAASLTIPSKYSCSDIPAASARRRRTACVRFGTFLIWMFFIACILHAPCHVFNPSRCTCRVTTIPGPAPSPRALTARIIRSDARWAGRCRRWHSRSPPGARSPSRRPGRHT